MSAVIGFQLENDAIARQFRLREATKSMNIAFDVQQAIQSVKPYGDHLGRWLAQEVSEHPLADKEWINGVLKETIADQYPYLPMVWLDERLPSGKIPE